VSSQLALPLNLPPALGRADFIVAPGNARAVAFIDSWPHWSVPVAALYGPGGAGKSHLAAIWHAASGAQVVPAAAVDDSASGPIAVEDIDAGLPDEDRDRLLFRLLERATAAAPVLLTGKAPPMEWPVVLPDLSSRFAALLALPVWAPDDALLTALAAKLLADRQLLVPPSVVERMVLSLERSPECIRAFIAKADARALSQSRPINLALVRELIAEEDERLS